MLYANKNKHSPLPLPQYNQKKLKTLGLLEWSGNAKRF